MKWACSDLQWYSIRVRISGFLLLTKECDGNSCLFDLRSEK